MKINNCLSFCNCLIFLSGLPMLFFACSQHEKEFKEENKILHAGPSSGGIGSLSFGLYNDSTYSISNSGGIGENVCTGTYSLNDNVIIFNNLDASSALKYNRLLILRNSGQDSLYWKNIYPPNSLLKWKQYRWQDSVMGSKGEIYQLNKYNQIATDKAHFIIRLDSLKKKISTID